MAQDSVQYDSDVLQTFADKLYRQARFLVFIVALRYGVITFSVAWLALSAASGLRMQLQSSDITPMAAFAGVIALMAGIEIGNRRAFTLRLQAQQVLCQRQIEINTRAYSHAEAASGR